MKKTLLLATTAIISAFALESMAASAPVTATFKTHVNVVHSLTAEATKILNFGTIKIPSSGNTDTISVDAHGTAGGTATRFTEPSAGEITIHYSGSQDNNYQISLAFSDITPLTASDGSTAQCGTIDPASFVQGSMTNVSEDDYVIPFGATLTVEGGYYYGPCSGTGVATIIRTVNQ